MLQTTRRRFLQATAGVALTPYFFSSVQPAVAQSVSDRLRVACIGLGHMGRRDGGFFSNMADVVALCDLDDVRLDLSMKESPLNRLNPTRIKDYRKVLERNDIDIVSIATPDHWHVKIAVEALQAGKHVFCEKPLTLTVEEGQLIRNACKKYNKQAFQVGTQQRSQEGLNFLNAYILIQKGLLGDVKKILCHLGSSPTCAPIPVAPVPETLDWERWLGQAPMTEYLAGEEKNWEGAPKQSRCHGVFRYWYDYAGGMFTDWGAHHVDCALWAAGQNGPGQGPVKFKPLVAEHGVPFKDGYPTENNRFNTATKFDIECTFESGMVMNIVNDSEYGNGILFEGTKGRIHVSRQRIEGAPFEAIKDEWHKGITEDDYVKAFKGKKRQGHLPNFLTCVREGGLPISDVFSHVQAMNVCHLAAISARLNREVKYDPKTETTGDAESQTFLARKRREGYDIPNVG